MKFILASGSPRRYEILKNLGLSFEVILPDADETCDVASPYELTEELARRKAAAVASGSGVSADDVIIACDTVVYNGEILGKPHTEERARVMLGGLSGKTHEVVSGICICRGGKTVTAHEVSLVTFDELGDRDVDLLVAGGEPCDKAGAYAVQGRASLFISGISGDYFNIVGLPVNLLAKTLKNEFGIELGDHIEKEER